MKCYICNNDNAEYNCDSIVYCADKTRSKKQWIIHIIAADARLRENIIKVANTFIKVNPIINEDIDKYIILK